MSADLEPTNTPPNAPPNTPPIPPASAAERIVAEEGAQLDFSKDMSYADYLHLDELLNAQHPISPNHNEICSSCSTRPASCG